MQLWIDADACPRQNKELLCRAAIRTGNHLTFVTNRSMFVPSHPLLRLQLVGPAFGAADDFIIQAAQSGDIAITDDIPLAAALVDHQVRVITNRGKVFTPENVKEALAIRNSMQELRGGLERMGGPSSPSNQDFELFANALDRELSKSALK